MQGCAWLQEFVSFDLHWWVYGGLVWLDAAPRFVMASPAGALKGRAAIWYAPGCTWRQSHEHLSSDVDLTGILTWSMSCGTQPSVHPPSMDQLAAA